MERRSIRRIGTIVERVEARSAPVPIPRFSDFEFQASALKNHYWHIRASRGGKIRAHYRRAAKEKGQLVALGYCPEVVRLYALYLRNPRKESRLQRAREAFYRSLNRAADPVQLALF